MMHTRPHSLLIRSDESSPTDEDVTASTTLLQRSMLPAAGFAEPELYARCSGAAALDDESATLQAGGVLTFDTSFGAFHAGRWRRLTTVDDLSVRVVATGVGRVEVVRVSRRQERVIAAAPIVGDGVTIDLGSLATSTWGVLYVRVLAEGRCTVQRVEWSTTAAPTHDVRLNLSITTFNRQQYVVPTVQRVLNLVRSSAILRGRVRVLVVDNASNLDLSAMAGDDLTLVRNRNLGGAGGFARGLMATLSQILNPALTA